MPFQPPFCLFSLQHVLIADVSDFTAPNIVRKIGVLTCFSRIHLINDGSMFNGSRIYVLA
ncbi:MAG: hypothetical protein DWI22_23220 [Planctomycetota bacterium]|nr:MAG: hypothetical protein DWI22_23220 [Planctomycetota bacterium]